MIYFFRNLYEVSYFRFDIFIVMITAEITVIPIGTENTSLSGYVAAAVSILEDMDLTYEINGVGTLIETDSVEKLFNAVKAMHELFLTQARLEFQLN